jgi:ADP-ribose pyrophosphatase YjhB (NUDIX family)
VNRDSANGPSKRFAESHDSIRRARHMKGHWLSSSDWKLVQSAVPVVCVDVLPVRISPARRGKLEAVGLILRDTPQEKLKWCLIGGRLLYRESLYKGIRRQIEQSLGRRVRSSLRLAQQPLYVAQYSPTGRKPFSLDSRQHSVGLTYVVEFKGEPVLAGEARLFQWFALDELPRRRQFGFGQDKIVRACIRLLRYR